MPRLKGLIRTTTSLLKPVWTRCNEFALGIETEPVVQNGRAGITARSWWKGEVISGASHDDNFHYATIDYWNVRRALQALEPGPADVFYDIGCGMGRILCVAARMRLRRCVGVDISGVLCAVARRNAAKLRGRKTPIEIVCGDATTADLSDGTIYFMFNPFGAETMRDTLQNIRDSLTANRRSIRLLYYNSEFQSVLESASWLEKRSEFKSFGGQQITLWESQHPEEAPAVSCLTAAN
ncbi:MAG TPA: class I SAM-dependent methyltransferase [Terriglobales bacterium]